MSSPPVLDDGAALAKALVRSFVTLKRRVLREVAAERRTPKNALATLKRQYARQTRDFLRVAGTTYSTWLDHGPVGELHEVRFAVRDDAVWDRLVERHAKEREHV